MVIFLEKGHKGSLMPKQKWTFNDQNALRFLPYKTTPTAF